MGRAPGTGGAPAFRFTAREVAEMEKALEANRGSTPARSVVQTLSDNFSASAERAGQKPIQWKQVWNWFQNRRHSQKAKIARSPDKVKSVTAAAPEPSQAKRVVVASAAVPSEDKRVPCLEEKSSSILRIDKTASTAVPPRRANDAQMEFEAKSARDGAWYDVSTFISHRLAASGDPEVRVRFAGFGSEEDEWVNVRTAVRQRSLPCEASECVAVLPGDLILCFQEGNEQALYYDADILDVQRRRHDVRGCRCRFWVRYRHDQAEEVVPLRKVCRRPETEYRLLKLQSYGKSPASQEGMQGAASRSESPAPCGLVSEVPGSGAVPESGSERIAAEVQDQTQASTSTITSAQATLIGTDDLPVSERGTGTVSSSSPMEVDAAPAATGTDVTLTTGTIAGPSAVVVTGSSSVPETSEQQNVPTVTPEGQGVQDTKGALEKQAWEQVVETSVPCLQAEPEMFDALSENIVVLDRVDLEGSRSKYNEETR